MGRLFFATLMLLLSGGWGANAQPLNCDSAFTSMEQAICGTPSLLDNYRQLNRLTAAAIRDASLSEDAAAELTDKLARSCRSSANLEDCLDRQISRAVTELQEVAATSPGLTGIDVQSEQAHSARALRHKVDISTEEYANTGNPEPLIVALLALKQHYESVAQTRTTLAETSALAGRLLKGCQDLSSRRQWNRALQTYGWHCPLSVAAGEFE